ncbi:helix-turn-helix domain-containing protein [Methylobacterium guangdongense]|uniref:helix-turn-helix domain-containing protein n=1 Tax=Methylobacterium guangdongense TaxID=3138811 RepID=UPI00399CF432
MGEEEARRQTLLGNLAAHAAPARQRLYLSVWDTARLAGLTLQAVEAIEQGKACMLPPAVLAEFAAFLGLTEAGLPRPRHPGMR